MSHAPRLAVDFPTASPLGTRLVVRGFSLAVAESCTGGLLGAAVTAHPGASRYLKGGVIAYSDEVKTELLRVDPGLLRRFGAVSAEVARAMAEGVARRLHADLGLAVTGIAGPGGESTDKPVGLIYVAASLRGDTRVVELRETGYREANRAAAVRAALALAQEVVATAR
ncbi:MAG: nicotinamide-nucleotide amidohydrolase family protein [Candidatus Dormibacteria bacterium]|jgi:PncC family amidohydrolase